MNNKPAKVLSFTISARIQTEPTKTDEQKIVNDKIKKQKIYVYIIETTTTTTMMKKKQNCVCLY